MSEFMRLCAQAQCVNLHLSKNHHLFLPQVSGVTVMRFVQPPPCDSIAVNKSSTSSFKTNNASAQNASKT